MRRLSFGNVPVMRGDIVIMDDCGVLILPPEEAPDVLEEAPVRQARGQPQSWSHCRRREARRPVRGQRACRGGDLRASRPCRGGGGQPHAGRGSMDPRSRLIGRLTLEQ